MGFRSPWNWVRSAAALLTDCYSLTVISYTSNNSLCESTLLIHVVLLYMACVSAQPLSFFLVSCVDGLYKNKDGVFPQK